MSDSEMIVEDILIRLQREAIKEPHEPIWRDAIAETDRLRSEIDRMRATSALIFLLA